VEEKRTRNTAGKEEKTPALVKKILLMSVPSCPEREGKCVLRSGRETRKGAVKKIKEASRKKGEETVVSFFYPKGVGTKIKEKWG